MVRRSLIALIVCLGMTHAFAQTRAGVSRATVARTPEGRPDLQGTWSNATLTPLERGPQFRDKAFYTAAEIADLEDTSKSTERLRRARGDL